MAPESQPLEKRVAGAGGSQGGQGRGEVLEGLLRRLVHASTDLEGAVLTGLDGLVIATAWSSAEQAAVLQGLDDSDIGAVACRAFEQSGYATAMLKQGELDRMILASSCGNVIITRAGQDALCVVLLHPDAKLGVASFEASRIGRQIAGLLG
jgi:predicted regulator of Ras-like GTPase activity (Roadblock/LC7/MglB family)